MTEELKKCLELLRGSMLPWPEYNNGPISPELADDYARILAAQEIGKLSPLSIVSQAALCRSALTANENDRVRIECVQQLLNNRCPTLETVLFALLFDEDEEMRLAAIEGLSLIQSSNLRLAASILAEDESESVRKLVSEAASGMAIDLYHLDPP